MNELSRTEYLYGIPASVIRDMPNLESLHYRKQHAKLLISELVEVHYYARDEERISESMNSIKWCDNAIKELT